MFNIIPFGIRLANLEAEIKDLKENIKMLLHEKRQRDCAADKHELSDWEIIDPWEIYGFWTSVKREDCVPYLRCKYCYKELEKKPIQDASGVSGTQKPTAKHKKRSRSTKNDK